MSLPVLVCRILFHDANYAALPVVSENKSGIIYGGFSTLHVLMYSIITTSASVCVNSLDVIKCRVILNLTKIRCLYKMYNHEVCALAA
jgi:hypothetical protein